MLTINKRKTFKPIVPLRLLQGINTFSKKEYDELVAEKREEFMFEHFPYELERIFDDLRQKASEMKYPLSHTISFRIQDYFDAIKTSRIIASYFQDLGYEVSISPINGENNVCFTLS